MTIEILCRVDRATRTPVVFIADSVNYETNTVDSWIKGDKQNVSLSYYHQTGPLSTADEQILRTRYMRNFGEQDVVVRHRLPRTKKQLEDILAKPGRQKKEAAPEGMALPAPMPQQEPTLDRRSTDKVPTTPEAVVMAPAPAVAALEATPQQLFAAIEQMRVETAKQIAESMAKLNEVIGSTPRKRQPAKQARATAKQVVASKATRKSAAKKIPTKV